MKPSPNAIDDDPDDEVVRDPRRPFIQNRKFLKKNNTNAGGILDDLEQKTWRSNVRYMGRTTPLALALESFAMRPPNTEPVHIIVHPDWPETSPGCMGLTRLAERLTRIQPEERVRLWQDNFRKSIHALRQQHASVAIIDDPCCEQTKKISQNHLHIPSMPAEKHKATGYVFPREIAKLIEYFPRLSSKSPITIHGASFRRCLRQFSLQLQTALHYGLYIDGSASLDQCVGIERKYINATLGLVMDCHGDYPLREDSTDYFTKGQMDKNTIVYPHQDAESMKGLPTYS